MAKPLAQVTDIEALDAHEGTCVTLPISVPASWRGATLEVTVPRLLSCARCDGGGCDRCARSGALRAPEEEGARQLQLTLPTSLGTGARIRVATPFEDPDIEQLILEVRVAEAASRGVRCVAVPGRVLAVPSGKGPSPALLIALILMVAIVFGVLLVL